MKNMQCKRIVVALAIFAGFVTGVQAWVGMETPSLHVDGRYLKDPNGKNVLLHGWMQPNDSYFNERLFTQPTTYTAADCAGALSILEQQAELLTDTSPLFGRTHGWYQSFVRIAAPGAGWGDTGLVDGDLADRAWDNLYIPYIDYCRSRGLYVVLIGSVPFEGELMGAQHKQNLIDYWARIAAYPGIKNADNVMFEILNEPVTIESVLGNGDWGTETTAHAVAMQDYMQDIVDAIRSTGATNVVWVPGLIWQAKLKNFVDYPVAGTNIGYSGHWYPIGNNDPATIIDNFNNDFKLCSDVHPVMITEGSWNTMDEDQGLRRATTDGWGITTKTLFDAAGNISWMTGMNGEVIGNLSGGPANWTYPEIACGRDSFEWWADYTWSAPGNAIPSHPAPAEAVNGLTYKYYEGMWYAVPDFDALTPVASGLCANFDINAYASRSADGFAYVFEGYIDIPTNGTYTFYSSSDDGSKLYVGPPEVVDNDGLHGMGDVSGTVALEAGKHAIRVAMFEKNMGEGLEVRWEGPGFAKALIPDAALFRDVTPPAVPTGLVATPAEGKVWVDWNDNGESDLVGYNVYRSTTSGSGYGKLNGSLPVDHLTISEYLDASVTNGTTYYYAVTAVDSSGNESGYSSEAGDITPLAGGGSGTILREWWEGISGSSVGDLTSDPNYPDHPTGSGELTSFEAPTDFADNYGTRVRGYLHPSYSVNYTFWIASDDNSELWLSTDDNPANAVKIASVPDWTDSREWTKYAQQQSAAIALTGGQRYYIEVRHKEGGWGDNLAVAWQRPGIGREVISGSYLSPWPLAAPTGLAATLVSVSQVDLVWTTSDGADSYNVKRSTSSGGPYTTIANVATTNYSDTGVSAGTTYYYVVSAVSSDGESADSAKATTLTERVLTGTVIGTTGSWGGDPTTTRDAAFDGNLSTFFDSDLATGGWTGLDLGDTAVVTEIRFAPRSGSQFPGRMVGGVFQASSTADFSSDVVTLYTVGSAPSEGVYTTNAISGAGAYRYVRYYGPTDGFCNVAEIEFYGLAAPDPMPPAAPAGLGAVAVSDSRIDLSWTASAGADSYNVKRSITSGALYETVGSNVVSTSYSDTAGLSAGTRYYYVVSAVNTGGESSDSSETNAVPSAVIVPGEYFIADHAIADSTNLNLAVSNSVPGHTYWIWASDSLTTPDWQPVGVGQAGTGSTLDFSVAIDGVSTNRYFKLDIDRQ